MRIVFVSHEFPPQFGGGIGTYVAAMSRILAARGHVVTMVTVTDKRCPERQWDDQVEVIRLPLPVVGGADPMGTLRCWQARADAVADLLMKMTRAAPIDVIEFADYRGEGATYLSSTEPGARPTCVVKLHTPLCTLYKYNRSKTRYPVLESFEDQAVLLADRVVSPSMALAREVREHLPELGDVDILPNPADPEFLEIDIDRAQPTAEVLYVGRLEERKGVETLIRAVPAFLEACPNATLHLAGGDTGVSAKVPSMKAHLLKLLPGRCLDRVIFHGAIPRQELIARYARARICVFPSLFENFPNTCLEAMSLGRPVIGTDNSGMAEMIEPGVSGLIARAGDVEHLAATLIDLYKKPDDVLRTMGSAARKRVHDAYRPDRIAQQLESLYRGYLGADWQPRLGPAAALGADRGDSSDQPAVAVIIPCFNHGRFLREALASVQAQDWPNVECVVVDDGSTDDETLRTLDELKDEGVRVIRQENQGLSAARNTGVRATSAPFFVALDADDKLAPGFISKLLPALLEDPSLGYCYGQVTFFGTASGRWECPAYDPRQLMVENLSVATALVRRSAFDEAGGYSPDMVHGFEDWDFWLALLSVGYHGRCVPEPVFFYRKHPAGRSMLDETQCHRAEMVRRMIAHHRPLFASMLECSMADKDSMFFRAHMEAWHLRETVAQRGGAPVATSADDELFQTLMARAELDYIENARSWQAIQRIKRTWLYRAFARIVYGKNWDQTEFTDPRDKLVAIKRSRFYRLLQAIKRTRLYRMYARRKYGPDFVNAWT